MNPTKWTTILGLVQAVGVAIADYLAHNPTEGGALKQPTFWVGIVIAAAMGVKGFLTQGIELKPATKPVEPEQEVK